jgi:hypothetical protein
VNKMCFVIKRLQIKCLRDESDSQFESRVNFVSLLVFGYFVVMSCIKV